MAALLHLLLVLCSTLYGLSSAHNVTHILGSFPSYSTFNSLLSKYGVAAQINSRQTITVLCPPNDVLNPVVSSLGTTGAADDAQAVFNVLSYHVLLDYYDPSKLKEITDRTVLVTTLYQTTGLASGNDGYVNITNVAGAPKVGLPVQGTPWKGTIGKALALYPYNISLLAIDSVLVPVDVTLAGASPSPSAAPINITQVVSQGGNFSTFISLLQSSGVDKIFQDHDGPPGLTIFVPTNAAFDGLPKGTLSRLSPAQKVALLEFHGLPSYYPMQALSTLASPQRTLATGSGGGSYTLTITAKAGSSPSINTGFDIAPVSATLYSINPVAIYTVSSVLMPTDIFGPAPSTAPAPSPLPPTPSPASTPTPPFTPSPAPLLPPTHTSPSPSRTPTLLPSTPAPAPRSTLNSPLAPSPEGASSSADHFSVSSDWITVLWLIMMAIRWI